jgi:hypothetical protein
MITFTVPQELRSLVYSYQRVADTLLFNCVISTLKTFWLNPRHLGAEIGATMVLHTNSRRLKYHF